MWEAVSACRAFADKFVAFDAGRQFFRFGSKTLGLLVETFGEGQRVLETASLHGAAPNWVETGESATGVLITDNNKLLAFPVLSTYAHSANQVTAIFPTRPPGSKQALPKCQGSIRSAVEAIQPIARLLLGPTGNGVALDGCNRLSRA